MPAFLVLALVTCIGWIYLINRIKRSKRLTKGQKIFRIAFCITGLFATIVFTIIIMIIRAIVTAF
ncbi:MAG: hypothetical protein MK052_10105 [Alphaproteobacteria bacterium]|nr:hypothetical protein [Alphaproteobacteria bacterium]